MSVSIRIRCRGLPLYVRPAGPGRPDVLVTAEGQCSRQGSNITTPWTFPIGNPSITSHSE
jgi:acyl-coenzyme A thioesterase PaaI-like protein